MKVKASIQNISQTTAFMRTLEQRMTNPGDWFESRFKCRECEIEGRYSDLSHYTRGFRAFPICPNCGSAWDSQNRNLSCISTFSVHKVCGKWHRERTRCEVEHES